MGQVLGTSAFYHDSAACLARPGAIVAALQEERESRRKHDPSFPTRAARACLAEGGVAVGDLDLVAFYELPFLHAERVLHSQIRFAPRGFRAFPRAVRALLGEKIWIEQAIARELGYEGPVLCVPHHMAHAASAFLPSPFEEAAILTVDGVGEWSTTTFGAGRGAAITLEAEQRFPHSLGLFYATMTAFCGLKVNSGEYKLMGLAPYGTPRFAEVLRREVIAVGADGSVRLNLRHFDFPAGTRMARPSLDALLGGPPLAEGAELGQREADLAASAQAITEEALLAMARHARASTGLRDLCLAGGVALNCVAVAKLLESGVFRDIFVQPAAGDAGGALGAALLGVQELAPGSRPAREPGEDAMRGARLGPIVPVEAMREALTACRLRFETLAPDALDEAVVDGLVRGEAVGWFEGRMEFGPRALGGRSILADPRGHDVRDRVNRDMKRREGFRPFAPAVLEEEASHHFAITGAAPYMTRTAPVLGFEGASAAESGAAIRGRQVRSPLPAVTHIDGSARLQTVARATHPRFHALLSAFHRRTGSPVLLNTSFNLRGEPMVASPRDACRTFAHSALHALAIGPFLVRRSAQTPDFAEHIDAPTLVAD